MRFSHHPHVHGHGHGPHGHHFGPRGHRHGFGRDRWGDGEEGRGGRRRRVFDSNELRLVLLKLIADQPLTLKFAGGMQDRQGRVLGCTLLG